MDYMGRYWESHFATNSRCSVCMIWGEAPTVTQACADCHKLHPDRPLLPALCISLAFSWTKGRIRTTKDHKLNSLWNRYLKIGFIIYELGSEIVLTHFLSYLNQSPPPTPPHSPLHSHVYVYTDNKKMVDMKSVVYT